MDLKSLGQEPIPGTSPAGQDARYDPEYDRLQAEIDKLNSVTNLAEVSWKRVVETASSILATKSKDLLAAVYLSVGLQHEAGLQGLATGSQVLRDMVNMYWDACFPPKKRLRGRMNAFSWWQEKTVALVKGLPPDPIAPELHRSVMENVTALDKALAELLPDFPPLRDLLTALKRLPLAEPPQDAASADAEVEAGDVAVHSAPPSPGNSEADQPEAQQEQQDAQEHSTARSSGAPSASPSASAPASVASPPATQQNVVPPEDVAAARKILVETARGFADIGRDADPTDPWVWRAARLAAWISVKTLPPNQGGQTMIPAPDADIKAALRKQFAEGRFLEAALAAERRFLGAIFWFDLQQVVATSLEKMGEEYACALNVVQEELRTLLTRFQGLDQLAFADGTPFADPETKSWIAKLTGGPRSGGSSGETTVVHDVSRHALELAESRYAQKDESGALDILSRALRDAPGGSVRMRLRLAQMDMLIRSGRFALAVALGEELLAEMERRDLPTWAPELAVETLRTCHVAYVGNGGESNLARARELAAMVGRIRPASALTLAI
ncbi:TssA family type VI secretion system protein [Desulfonatronum thioautotrophicum]|uniref:TssA family type VI secretion system protein n=1 Tax=Desulfonatronum thioautotrophicum TaxID=617001 RepID=UPI0005EADA40|nr:TssA family type VI secretion system protein [Desulfonatronum thioautotrophicum]